MAGSLTGRRPLARTTHLFSLLSFAVWPAAHSPAAAAAPSHPLHVTSPRSVRPSRKVLARPTVFSSDHEPTAADGLTDYVSADRSLLLPRSTNLKISHARAVTTQRVSSASGDHFFLPDGDRKRVRLSGRKESQGGEMSGDTESRLPPCTISAR